jgi:hypothetical protein
MVITLLLQRSLHSGNYLVRWQAIILIQRRSVTFWMAASVFTLANDLEVGCDLVAVTR